MPHDIRRIRASEFTDWRVMVRLAFNEHVLPEDVERLRTQRAELDRLYAAFDGDRIVGTGGVDSHELTLPGATTTPAAGVAYIGTAPTHRRRGIQRQVMAKVEEAAREHEETVAILWASQGGLYDRFGYGMATVHENWRISTEHSAFLRHLKSRDGVTVRLADAAEAHQILPRVYEERRKLHPGFVDVSESRWKYILFDEQRVRGGASAYFYAIAERHGRPEGYAVYRIKRTGDFDLGTLNVIGGAIGLMAVTDDAESALLRYLLDMDLVDTVTINYRPVDDPAWWRLVDPRRLQRHREDAMWLKLLDPQRALAKRRYAVADTLVVAVRDGDTTSTYEIEGEPGGASCKITGKAPDLEMRLPELSSAYLGESHFVAMRTAGRVDERTPGAARRADLMFGWRPRPWAPYFF